MKKRISQRRFHRKEGPRKGLQKSLLRSLVEKGKMRTTQAKAKEIAPQAERLVSKAKQGSLAQRRQLTAVLGANLAKKLVEELAPRYKERQGGYTRIFKLAPRKSDNAKMAVVEFI